MGLFRLVLATSALLTLGGVNAVGGSVKIIANRSVKTTTVSMGELKSIFLQGKNALHDGSAAVAVLQKSGAIHELFLSDVLGESDEELQGHYRRMAFTGTGTVPKSFGSDAEVVAYVAKSRGAIGYVSSETDTQGVKTLTVMRVNSGPERPVVTSIEPEYPAELNVRKIGGMVRLKVTVSANGAVEHVELIGGNPVLAESAMHAVEQWKYAPARASSVVELSIPFDPRS